MPWDPSPLLAHPMGQMACSDKAAPGGTPPLPAFPSHGHSSASLPLGTLVVEPVADSFHPGLCFTQDGCTLAWVQPQGYGTEWEHRSVIGVGQGPHITGCWGGPGRTRKMKAG